MDLLYTLQKTNPTLFKIFKNSIGILTGIFTLFIAKLGLKIDFIKWFDILINLITLGYVINLSESFKEFLIHFNLNLQELLNSFKHFDSLLAGIFNSLDHFYINFKSSCNDFVDYFLNRFNESSQNVIEATNVSEVETTKLNSVKTEYSSNIENNTVIEIKATNHDWVVIVLTVIGGTLLIVGLAYNGNFGETPKAGATLIISGANSGFSYIGRTFIYSWNYVNDLIFGSAPATPALSEITLYSLKELNIITQDFEARPWTPLLSPNELEDLMSASTETIRATAEPTLRIVTEGITSVAPQAQEVLKPALALAFDSGLASNLQAPNSPFHNGTEMLQYFREGTVAAPRASDVLGLEPQLLSPTHVLLPDSTLTSAASSVATSPILWAEKLSKLNKRFYSSTPIVKYSQNKILLGTKTVLLAKWYYETYSINKLTFNKDIIKFYITMFWYRTVILLNEKHAMYFIFKVKYIEHPTLEYMTLYRMFTIKSIFEDHYNELLNQLFWAYDNKDDRYKNSTIDRVIFSYKIIPLSWVKESTPKNSSFVKELGTSKNVEYLFQSFDLPQNMDYETWGTVVYNSKTNDFLIIENNIKKITYKVTKHFTKIKIYDTANIELINQITNKTIITFQDSIYNKNINIFQRFIDHYNHEYFYNENKLICKIIEKKVNVIAPINQEKKLVNKFITLDIETMVLNNIHIPFCICFFDGLKAYSFYLTDYNGANAADEMLQSAIEALLKPKYSGYIIYIHNLSKFDGVFLFKFLALFKSDKINTKFTPINRDGNIINWKFNYSNVDSKRQLRYFINFRDSLLMLPESLDNLALTLDFNYKKTIYPYKFVNDIFNKNCLNNIIKNYESNVPDLNFFPEHIKPNTYKEYILSLKNANKWNLKEETIKYCLNDCRVLYKVIETLNKLIFDLFKTNIHSFPTLPSLAFAIFRMNFLKKNMNIPQITGKIFKDIQQAYFGGHTDMYIPAAKYAKCYDVNSLYPAAMKQWMPTAFVRKNAQFIKEYYIKEFEGNLSLVEHNPFGFFYVEITCPDHLNNPILPLRFNTGDGIKSIYPTGKWYGWYYFEELKNAIKVGYTYKIIRGYIFNQQQIFDDYVNKLYNLKSSHNKNHPLYKIAKLLLNSLYGRFGMSIITNNQLIIDEKDLPSYQNKGIIREHMQINDEKSFIIFEDPELIEQEFFKNLTHKAINNKFNISIPIAAAITANARIFMSLFKNNPDINLLYTDTDSIFIKGNLDKKFIGTGLGQFKLENHFKEIVFLAPKAYGGITYDNKQISVIKGYKHQVPFKKLKSLLKLNNSIELNQDKWFKNFLDGKITILNQIYKLKTNSNKRELIYNPRTKLLQATKPYKILFDKIIKDQT